MGRVRISGALGFQVACLGSWPFQTTVAADGGTSLFLRREGAGYARILGTVPLAEGEGEVLGWGRGRDDIGSMRKKDLGSTCCWWGFNFRGVKLAESGRFD